jgi:hypothetical protein
MGDGEARFLAYGDPALRGRLSAAEVEMLGEVPFRNWFGQPAAEADAEEVRRLQAATIMAMERADILGVPSAERLARDNLHFGYLGHMEALIGSIAHTGAEMAFTDAFVPIALHRCSPFLGDILVGLDFLGVISPHPGLAWRLARLHGIPEFAEYLIPGESRLPEGQRRREGAPHFPDVYHDLCRRITVPWPGSVFLVAGGLLAKIYCARIRERGGIAIDVGSVVDGWMGLNTRPGFLDHTAEWALPPEE